MYLLTSWGYKTKVSRWKRSLFAVIMKDLPAENNSDTGFAILNKYYKSRKRTRKVLSNRMFI